MHSTVAEISPEALTALQQYSWPGNIRELQSVLRQAMLSARGAVLLPDDLPQWLRNPTKAALVASNSDWGPFVENRIAAGSQELYDEALKRMEAEVLVHVLKHTQGNQVQAAKILGITRGNLRTKLRVLGITINRSVWAEAEPEG